MPCRIPDWTRCPQPVDTGTMTHEHDPACAVAHGDAPGDVEARMLVAVFASPVAEFLLRYGADLGYRGVLLEPDPERAKGPGVVTEPPHGLDGSADVVLTDHHR